MDINMNKAAAVPSKEGTYDPGCRRRLRYGMSKSGWLVCSGVTSCKSRPDPKRSFTQLSSYFAPYIKRFGEITILIINLGSLLEPGNNSLIN
eukprot:14989064-Ditylum_brightwellii.AAC.1